MTATTMKTFWTSRRAGWSSPDSGSLLLWDVLRGAVFLGGFVVGWLAHEHLVDPANATTSPRVMMAITTFGTFLASFVMTLMTSTGKREFDLMRDGESVRLLEDRLRWLMSDQLVMVVTALAAAASAIVWLGMVVVLGAPVRLVSALVLGFTALALLNALRLPFQVWEVQSSALTDERRRAIKRLNDETDRRFGDR